MDKDTEYIVLPSEKEIKADWEEYHKLLDWAHTLSQDQMAFLCNAGWYNDTIRGYLIAAAREAEFTDKQIQQLLNGLRWALSEKTKADADEVYRRFYEKR